MNYRHYNTLEGHKAPIYALCKGAEPHLFYSAGADQQVVLWNLKSMQAVKVVSKAPTTVISLLYINSLNYLLIGQVEGGVHVIDLNKGKEIKYLKLHAHYIFDLLFIPEKNELVCSSGDGSISVWSVPMFELLYHKKISNKKNRKMDFSANRNELAVSSGDGKVFLFNVSDWSINNVLDGFKSSIDAVKYNSKKNTLLIGEKDALLHEYTFEDNKLSDALPAHYWAIYEIDVSPTNNLFATASRDKTVKIWNASTLKVLKRFEGIKDKGHTHSVNAMFWSTYNSCLVSAGDDTTIKVWEILEV
ncbi:MAG: WD40 repeat domain-containing protein [Vicingaceae bacterium]